MEELVQSEVVDVWNTFPRNCWSRYPHSIYETSALAPDPPKHGRLQTKYRVNSNNLHKYLMVGIDMLGWRVCCCASQFNEQIDYLCCTKAQRQQCIILAVDSIKLNVPEDINVEAMMFILGGIRQGAHLFNVLLNLCILTYIGMLLIPSTSNRLLWVSYSYIRHLQYSTESLFALRELFNKLCQSWLLICCFF